MLPLEQIQPARSCDVGLTADEWLIPRDHFAPLFSARALQTATILDACCARFDGFVVFMITGYDYGNDYFDLFASDTIDGVWGREMHCSP